MNRSSYLSRNIDKTDHAIIAALADDGRISIKDLAKQIGMSSPSVAARILKMKDAGAIKGYTVVIDPLAFGLSVTAYVRLSAISGELNRLKRMLSDIPQVVEANHVSGNDCFVAKVMVRDVNELDSLIERFSSVAATESNVILSSTVPRRLPKL